jgi:WD40 repeat protein
MMMFKNLSLPAVSNTIPTPTLFPIEGVGYQAAYSPTGVMFATLSYDATNTEKPYILQLWKNSPSQDTSVRLLEKRAFPDPITSMDFSGNGEYFAVSTGCKIQLFAVNPELEKKRILLDCQTFDTKTPIVEISFSKDPNHTYIGAIDKNGVYRWNFISGNVLDDLPFNTSYSFKMAPDGKSFFVISFKAILQIDIDTKKTLAAYLMEDKHQSGAPLQLVVSEDRKRVAVLSTAGADVWEVGKPEPLQSWNIPLTRPSTDKNKNFKHEFPPSIALSSDGTQLAISTYTGKITVWNTDTGELTHTFPAPAFSLENATQTPLSFLGLAFVNKNTQVVSAKCGRVWTLNPPAPEIFDYISPTHSDRYIVCRSNRGLTIRELETGTLQGPLKGLPKTGFFDISNTGKDIVFAEGSNVSIYNIQEKTLTLLFKDDTNAPYRDITFLYNNQILCVGQTKVTIYDPATHTIADYLEGQLEPTSVFTFSKNKTTFVFSKADHTCTAWSPFTKKEKTSAPLLSPITNIFISPESCILSSKTSNAIWFHHEGTFRLFSHQPILVPASSNKPDRIRMLQGNTTGLHLTEESTASHLLTLAVITTPTPAPSPPLVPEEPHLVNLFDNTGEPKQWDEKMGRIYDPNYPDYSNMTFLAFNATASMAAIGAESGNISIWDLDKVRLCAMFNVGFLVNRIEFCNNDRSLIVVTKSTFIQRWDITDSAFPQLVWTTEPPPSAASLPVVSYELKCRKMDTYVETMFYFL